jgi:two-component system, NarL family, nitrate/nitrite response regulator NarL
LPKVPISLVLADDHPLVLDGLESLFRTERDFRILERCSNGDEALRAVHRHWPDILLLDVRLPGKDGLAVLRSLRDLKVPTRVVLLTAALDEGEVVDALRLGARGVVLKEMRPDYLIECIRKVYAGEQWIEQRSLGRVIDRLLRREAGEREVGTVLTRREVEIVVLVARGLHNEAIADRLGISEGTVKAHLHNIYEKLQLDGRVALVLYARSKDLI